MHESFVPNRMDDADKVMIGRLFLSSLTRDSGTSPRYLRSPNWFHTLTLSTLYSIEYVERDR
jgi:hypothetical protein